MEFLTFFLTDKLTTSSSIVELEALWVVLGAIVTLLIMFFIITWFGYLPIRKFTQTRTNIIQKDLDDAKQSNEIAEKSKIDANKFYKKASSEYRENIEKTKLESEKLKKELTDNAKKESQKIISDSEERAISQAEKIKEEAMKEVSDIAILAAKKIIDKEIDEDLNKKLINDLLKDL